MKQFKKLAMLIAGLWCCMAMNAHDFEVDGIYYNILTAKRVEVTYKAPSYYGYDEYAGKIEIPKIVKYDGTNYIVTSIGEDAFHDCTGLTSVTIPNSVTSIGEDAFSSCGLSTVEIKDLAAWCNIIFENGYSNPLSCAEHLYLNGEEVKDLIIPNSVTSIGDYAFYDCEGLTSITIPNSVTSIGESAFEGCAGLTSIAIPNSVTSIGERAFLNCEGLTSITIPNSVTSIGESAFLNCEGLTSITIPNSVTSIGNYAFSGCTGLTGITIPNSVTSIGDYAFYYCTGLTSITIPNSVTSIGDYAFKDCTGLKTVINNSSLDISAGSKDHGYVARYADKVFDEQIGDFIFYKTVLVGYIGNQSELSLPEDYKGEKYMIGENAFRDNTNLTSVFISASVTSIGSYAFKGCSNLKLVCNASDLDINRGSSENGFVAYYADKVVIGDDRIGDFFFLTTNGIHYLSGYAGNETELNLPENYKGEYYEIRRETFSYCTGLTSITIPNSVTGIGNMAFYYCQELTSITIPNSVTSIGDYAFQYCTELTSITIPNSVTTIGVAAISNCPRLTSITIPNSVTSIGIYAFSGNTGLTSITIPNSVTSIEENAFDGCTDLTDIEIPNSVTSIGDDAFHNCI